MIIGAHAIVYSRDAEADRAFLRDVIGLRGVDVGGGWLIFALPPAEVAVHPSASASHELYLMCDDVDALVADMSARGIACSPVEDLRWGRLTRLTLPGGGPLGVYQPLHARPPAAAPKGKPAREKPAARRKPKARSKITPKKRARR